jgi:hypothetical protein
MNRSPFSEGIMSEPVEQLSKFLPLVVSEKLTNTECAAPETVMI